MEDLKSLDVDLELTGFGEEELARRLKTGELVYEWRPTDGQQPRVIRQDQHEIMHLRSFIGKDGISGMSVIEMARESFGMALAIAGQRSRRSRMDG